MNILKEQDIDLIMVDDETDILEISELALNRQNNNINIESTTSPEEVIDKVENDNVDAILSDYNMPEMNGLELLEDVREYDEHLPFILYTGVGSEEIAEEAIHAGVTDYFQKEAGMDHYKLINNSIENSVEKYRDMERAEILSILVEKADQPIVVTDTNSDILYVNEALEEVSGYSEEELLGNNPNILSSGEHSKREFEDMYNQLNSGEAVNIDGMKNRTKEGKIYVHDQEIIPVNVHNGSPDYFVGISEVKN